MNENKVFKLILVIIGLSAYLTISQLEFEDLRRNEHVTSD